MNGTLYKEAEQGTAMAVCRGVLQWVTFGSVSISTLAGPWLFGGWESLWFWLLTAAVSVGVFSTGLQLILPAASAGRMMPRRTCYVLLAAIPFVVYAIIRLYTTEVFMDAERSVLLHVTALCVAGEVLFGLNARQRKLMFWMLFGNLVLLGVYGVVNHLLWHSEHVLWAPRYEQYAGRATGSYFCPDHFAGAMELLLCLALGVLANRGGSGTSKWLAAVAGVIAVVAVVMTKSRGGGMTVVVVLGFALVCGVAQWPAAIRWNLRLVGVCTSLLLFMALLHFGDGYVQRFASYGGGWGKGAEQESSIAAVAQALRGTSRGRMYGGALRAWRTAPWVGIGPGMHQHLWPHFAPTPDGNVELGVWPTQTNHHFRSYEVHSDWLQLLEEYGLAGLFFFLLPCIGVIYCFIRGVSEQGRSWQQSLSPPEASLTFACWLGGALALVAMGFHSLGDFNLQMPGTVWLFAAIMAIPLAGGDVNPTADRRPGSDA
jgi:O-antigen ligase